MNPIAEEIKSRLSMLMVAERYGLKPNRSGFISCPFHEEDTPSLKMYAEPGRGFHCFGCQTNGSVIDFVMRLFRINYQQALARLDCDFGIGLIGNKPDIRAIKRWQKEHSAKLDSEKKRQEKIQTLTEEYCRLWQISKFSEPWSDEWCNALYRLADIDFLLEVT